MNIRELIEEAKKPMSELQIARTRLRLAEAELKFSLEDEKKRITQDWLDRTYDI